MIAWKKHFIVYGMISGIMILAFLYVVEQNAILGDRVQLLDQKTLIKELRLANQEILRNGALSLLEDRFEVVKEGMRLEPIKKLSLLEQKPSEYSLRPKHYE